MKITTIYASIPPLNNAKSGKTDALPSNFAYDIISYYIIL